MSETKSVFLWWWPWQTEKIESMLEGMAAQGWKLTSVRMSCTSFLFAKSEPAKVRYCLDYQEKEKTEYLLLLADAGWRKEFQSSGWYIWSKPYTDDKPELFTDVDSLLRRNNAILGSMSAVFAAQIPIMTVTLQNIDDKSPFVIGLIVLWALVVAVLAGSVIGMALGISKIKKLKGLK